MADPKNLFRRGPNNMWPSLTSPYLLFLGVLFFFFFLNNNKQKIIIIIICGQMPPTSSNGTLVRFGRGLTSPIANFFFFNSYNAWTHSVPRIIHCYLTTFNKGVSNSSSVVALWNRD